MGDTKTIASFKVLRLTGSHSLFKAIHCGAHLRIGLSNDWGNIFVSSVFALMLPSTFGNAAIIWKILLVNLSESFSVNFLINWCLIIFSASCWLKHVSRNSCRSLRLYHQHPFLRYCLTFDLALNFFAIHSSYNGFGCFYRLLFLYKGLRQILGCWFFSSQQFFYLLIVLLPKNSSSFFSLQ
jgi:hypothetical protein